MKIIEWKIVINDNNKIANLETLTNLSLDNIENQLLIIGVLENMKQHHLDKLNTIFDKTIKK